MIKSMQNPVKKKKKARNPNELPALHDSRSEMPTNFCFLFKAEHFFMLSVHNVTSSNNWI